MRAIAVLAVLVVLFLPVAALAQQQCCLTPMPMFSQPQQLNFGSAYNDCPQGSACGQAANLAGQLINAGGFIGGMGVLRPPVTNYSDSFNSAAGANSQTSSSSLSSSTSQSQGGNAGAFSQGGNANATGGQGGNANATGGQGGTGQGGAGGQGGQGGTGGQGGQGGQGGPAGGGPINPNP